VDQQLRPGPRVRKAVAGGQRLNELGLDPRETARFERRARPVRRGQRRQRLVAAAPRGEQIAQVVERRAIAGIGDTGAAVAIDRIIEPDKTREELIMCLQIASTMPITGDFKTGVLQT